MNRREILKAGLVSIVPAAAIPVGANVPIPSGREKLFYARSIGLNTTNYSKLEIYLSIYSIATRDQRKNILMDRNTGIKKVNSTVKMDQQ